MFKCVKSFLLKRKLSKIKRKIDAHYYAAVEFQRNGKLKEYAQSLKEAGLLEDYYEKTSKE